VAFKKSFGVGFRGGEALADRRRALAGVRGDSGGFEAGLGTCFHRFHFGFHRRRFGQTVSERRRSVGRVGKSAANDSQQDQKLHFFRFC